MESKPLNNMINEDIYQGNYSEICQNYPTMKNCDSIMQFNLEWALQLVNHQWNDDNLSGGVSHKSHTSQA
jgi:hypothetical protein